VEGGDQFIRWKALLGGSIKSALDNQENADILGMGGIAALMNFASW